MAAAPTIEEANTLLAEWLAWWSTSDAPAKMPEALHVRTAVHLVTSGTDTPPIAHNVLRGGAMAASLSQALGETQ